MGTDKGLIQKDGKTWAEIAHNKLTDLGIPVYVSVHSSQHHNYQDIFVPSTLIVDSLPLRGPLAGLLSAHQKLPQTDWLVLACDLPDMQPEVLKLLRQQYTQATGYDCFVFESEGEAEPLCGIYKAVGLQKILHLFQQNELPKHSMKYVLDVCRTYLIPLPDDFKTTFQNYNAPEDLGRRGFGV